MSLLPAPIAELVAELGKLPGIGPRSAERLALYLVQADPKVAETLASVLASTRRRVRSCVTCAGLSESEVCGICSDPRRDASLVCVVEKAVDVLLFERSGTYRGKYHVLGGKLSPPNGVEPEDLNIDRLEQRVSGEGIREVILALPTDVEGDVTSHYLAARFAPRGIRISRLAQGLPLGTSLEYADELTLSRALEGRQSCT